MARVIKGKGDKAPDLNPANLLTMLRIVLVPVFAGFMLYHQAAGALGVYALAALTDLADGWLARRYGWVTAMGIFIDPMADKLLQLTAVTLLAVHGYAPLWVAVALWTREVVVVSGFTVLAMLRVTQEVHSSGWGKAGTMAQMLALGVCLAAPVLGFSAPGALAAAAFLAVATPLNFLSGLEYAWKGFQVYEQHAKKDRPR
jgi:CDP-diacylglycerol--glycerol-3-phosphate 3-phosphatidyltransferase